MRERSILNWSGGKDSALAYYRLLQEKEYKIESFFTTLNGSHRRISMHGVSEDLLDRQVKAIGVPLQKLYLSEKPAMGEYNESMTKALLNFRRQGISHSVYGDIFLEDLREYRDEQLKAVQMHGVYPLWRQNTLELVEEFLDLGFKTIVVSIDANLLDKSFCGRVLDRQFLNELPPEVDPCGENGEFHTFVFDGPIFSESIPVAPGEKVYKTYPSPDGNGEAGFWFCELRAD